MTAISFSCIGRPELDPPTTSAVATVVGANTLMLWWQMVASLVEGHVAANVAWMRAQPTPPLPWDRLGLRVRDRGSVVVEGVASALLVQLAPALLSGETPANCIDAACYVCAYERLVRPSFRWSVVFDVRAGRGHAFVVGNDGPQELTLDPVRS